MIQQEQQDKFKLVLYETLSDEQYTRAEQLIVEEIYQQNLYIRPDSEYTSFLRIRFTRVWKDEAK